MSCPHELIETPLDRWSECHWHIHQMELNYHEPEPFRYALNSFIRAFKEVHELIAKSLQHRADLKVAIKPAELAFHANDLYQVLHKKRNFIVHHGMLNLQSKGSVGTVEGRRVKISIAFHVDPQESSMEAYVRFKALCKANAVVRGLAGPDCDSQPAVWRTWMIQEFPDRDLLDVAFEAWQLLGALLSAIMEAQGGERFDLTLPCRHDPELVKIKRFSQEEFFLDVDGVDLVEEERLWKQSRALSTAGPSATDKGKPGP